MSDLYPPPRTVLYGATIEEAFERAGRLLEAQAIHTPGGMAYHGTESVVDRSRAIDKQEGGGHYKDMTIQPVEYIHGNNIPFIEGCVIKYVSRWRNKNGVEDLKKAKHFLELLIELENNKEDNAI